MNLDKLNELVGSIKKDLGNEQFSTAILANKIAASAVANPNDMTLRMMSNVLQKMASDGRPFIQRDQLQGLYKQFYSRNTQADSVLSDELALESKTLKNTYASKSYAKERTSKSVLSNVYEGILDKEFTPSFYDKKVASHAAALVVEYLDGQGLTAKAEVINGTPDTILTLASVQTPKGITSFYVPVELSGTVALVPNRFISHYGSADFKFASAYVLQHTGEQVKVASDVVFNSLLKKEAKDISKVDLAVAQKRMNDSKAVEAENLKTTIANVAKPAKHKYSAYVPVDTIAFSKKLATASGSAELEFGSGIVRQAGEAITATLRTMGFKPLALEVAGTSKNTLKFAVKVANASFFVPVKVDGDKVFNPQVIINNGNIASFSKDTVNALVRGVLSDSRALNAIASSSTISANDLMTEFKTSIASNNIDRAEEVLGYLQVKSPSGYKEAVALFMDSLSGNTKVADGCTSYFVGKNSAYPTCNHTGLPMNKVAQDKDGKCYALTSKK